MSLGALDKLEPCNGVLHLLNIDRIADVSPTMANEDANPRLSPAHLNITIEVDFSVAVYFLMSRTVYTIASDRIVECDSFAA